MRVEKKPRERRFQVPVTEWSRQFKSRKEFDDYELEQLRRGEICRFFETTEDTYKEFNGGVYHCVELRDGKIRAWYERRPGEFIREDVDYLKRWQEARRAEGVRPDEGDPRWQKN
jgi:hypothetical protein